MTNYGCIIAGNLGTSAHLLDGWTYKENEEGFDVVQSEWIATNRDYFPQKLDSVGGYFGFSYAYVTDTDVQPEGDLFVAKITAKGLKESTGTKKIRISSQTQSVKKQVATLIGTSVFWTTDQYNYTTPVVTVNRVDTASSLLVDGTNATPPIVPDVQTLGTGSIRNIPSGWVVSVAQEGVGANLVGTAFIVPLWSITEEYRYVNEWADGTL